MLQNSPEPQSRLDVHGCKVLQNSFSKHWLPDSVVAKQPQSNAPSPVPHRTKSYGSLHKNGDWPLHTCSVQSGPPARSART